MVGLELDGSLVLTDDTDPSRTQTVPATATAAERTAAIVAFFPVPVPEAVDAWKGEVALSNAGLLDQATAAANGAGGATLLAFNYAPSWSRNSDLLNSLATVLSLTSEQVDELFRQAAAVSA